MLRHAPFDSEPYRQKLFTRLWRAAKARRIPPIWVDEDRIRILSGDQLMVVSTAHAERLLKGEPVETVLEFRATPFWEAKWMNPKTLKRKLK